MILEATSDSNLTGGGNEPVATIGGTEMRFSLSLIASAASVALAAISVPAQSLNIDFGSREGTPSSSFGAAAHQAGAWNTLDLGETGSLLGLSGAPTAVRATVTAGAGDGWYPDCSGDLQALVADNFYTCYGGWSVVLKGLQNAPYRAFLYGPINASVLTGSMTVNGLPVAGVSGDTCDLSSGASHATVVVTVTDGVLTIIGEPLESSLYCTGLAGLQLEILPPLRPLRRALKGTKVS